jgi:hypothetical protein
MDGGRFIGGSETVSSYKICRGHGTGDKRKTASQEMYGSNGSAAMKILFWRLF